MKQPRFTDNRYPNGYVPAARTDIQTTFRRVRRKIEEAAEAMEKRRTDKVRQIK